ncbi:DUF4363 family protein [Marasmitruncus massiliensis]|uniref:DUF4363 family protein n=1 Tax=Marasmitruncus massiliensis TaxID=1944642 RepID=UPI000C7B7CF0|nr:DUF4363 family protein [Marasmitruncus massiliensis]
MKRFFLSIVICTAIITACIWGLFRITKVTDQLTASLNQIASAVEQQNTDQVVDLVGDFQKDWEENEKTLMQFIHHDELDTATGIVARLKALARYQDYSELSAEIDRLQHLIRHICESQMPIYKNIF